VHSKRAPTRNLPSFGPFPTRSDFPYGFFRLCFHPVLWRGDDAPGKNDSKRREPAPWPRAPRSISPPADAPVLAHESLHVHRARDLVNGRRGYLLCADGAVPEHMDEMRKHAERDDAVRQDGGDEVAERGHRGLWRKRAVSPRWALERLHFTWLGSRLRCARSGSAQLPRRPSPNNAPAEPIDFDWPDVNLFCSDLIRARGSSSSGLVGEEEEASLRRQGPGAWQRLLGG
jgi:hypothetical protein